MKRFKLGLALLLGLGVLGSVLAGCDNGSGGRSGEDALALAREKYAAVESMSYETENRKVFADPSGEGETMQFISTSKVNCILDPMAVEMEYRMDAGALGVYDMPCYIRQEGEDCMAYFYLEEEEAWKKQVWTDVTILHYDGTISMELILDNVQDLELTEAGTVNGRPATRYVGALPADCFDRALMAADVRGELIVIGLEDETAMEVYQAAGRMPVTIWIDDETGFPVQFEMEMTETVQAIWAQLIEEEQDGFGSGDWQEVTRIITVTDTDNVMEIVIPADALSAS